MSLLDPILRRLGLERKKPATAKRFFAGAQFSRLTGDFSSAGLLSADQEIRFDMRTLRARARQLCRDNPMAVRYLDMCSQNIVGHRGVRLQARNRNLKDELDDTGNAEIERGWKDWGKLGSCTADGRCSWLDVEDLAVRTRAMDGEFFARKVPGYPNAHGFALQVLDADQFDADYHVSPGRGQNEIRMGVEIDRWGRPVAYWMWTRHPNGPDLDRQRIRVPAAEIIHYFKPHRVGATRGITDFFPVLLALKMLDGYTEAELVAARTGAAKMGFILPGVDAEGPDVDENQPRGMDATPGVIDRLAPGETFASFDPSHPAGNFDPFVKANQRLTAMGLGVSYMGFTGDLNGTSYSSGRIGLLDERDKWKREQQRLAEHVCDPVFEGWLPMALLSGAITVDSRRASEWTERCWMPRGFPWVDPLKDIEAAALAVDHGFDSRRRIVADEGEDFAEILEEISDENALAQSLGVTLATAIPTTVAKLADEGAPTNEQGTGQTADAAANGNSGKGRARLAGGGRQPHPRLAVVRAAR